MSAIIHTWCGLSANLGSRSETCCTRLAENAGRKKSPKNRHLRTIVQLCRAISSQLRHYRQSEKKLLSNNISSRCSHNMVNFGLLAAEIGPVVWGTPVNFNGFHVLAALLHGSQVVGISQTAALNRGRHICSAGRPSRWALAHILFIISQSITDFQISKEILYSSCLKCITTPCLERKRPTFGLL